jgi:hypothetical protein
MTGSPSTVEGSLVADLVNLGWALCQGERVSWSGATFSLGAGRLGGLHASTPQGDRW